MLKHRTELRRPRCNAWGTDPPHLLSPSSDSDSQLLPAALLWGVTKPQSRGTRDVGTSSHAPKVTHSFFGEIQPQPLKPSSGVLLDSPGPAHLKAVGLLQQFLEAALRPPAACSQHNAHHHSIPLNQQHTRAIPTTMTKVMSIHPLLQ